MDGDNISLGGRGRLRESDTPEQALEFLQYTW